MEALYTLEGQAPVRNFPEPVASPSLLLEELGGSWVPVTKFKREENRCLQRILLWGTFRRVDSRAQGGPRSPSSWTMEPQALPTPHHAGEGKNTQNPCQRSGAPRPGGWGQQAQAASFESLGTPGWLEPVGHSARFLESNEMKYTHISLDRAIGPAAGIHPRMLAHRP